MPFKNIKQQKKCYALKVKGKNGSWDCDKWMAETKKKSTKSKNKKK
jgi:hypothetical protein